jgi:hypothetical protein
MLGLLRTLFCCTSTSSSASASSTPIGNYDQGLSLLGSMPKRKNSDREKTMPDAKKTKSVKEAKPKGTGKNKNPI